jgi:hypothetical protein
MELPAGNEVVPEMVKGATVVAERELVMEAVGAAVTVGNALRVK